LGDYVMLGFNSHVGDRARVGARAIIKPHTDIADGLVIPSINPIAGIDYGKV
jgi:carbonic anhydrase/acetyltransferase-like protein (isoleucine patch superfamily)